jgi:hypothetical protein
MLPATYLSGTLIGMVWGAFLAAAFAAWQHTLGAYSLLIWVFWGTFLTDGYVAWQHTSGAHSFGWCGGHSCLLGMLPSKIPQGQTHRNGVGHFWLPLDMLPGDIHQGNTLLVWVAWGAFLAAGYAAGQHTSGAHSFGWCGGTFLTAGYAAWQHTSGAHSFG